MHLFVPRRKSAARAREVDDTDPAAANSDKNKKDASWRTNMTIAGKGKETLPSCRSKECAGQQRHDRRSPPPPRRWADRPLVRAFCCCCLFGFVSQRTQPKSNAVCVGRGGVPERDKHAIAVQTNHDVRQTASNRDSFDKTEPCCKLLDRIQTASETHSAATTTTRERVPRPVFL